MDRKYIIYLSTNLENGMVYKGVHLNNKIDPYEFDGYLGSGTDIKKAIKEFGRKNFKRETLFVFNTKEEAVVKEKEEIPVEYVNDPNTYNRTVGGGDWPVIFGREKSEEEREKLSISKRGSKNPNYNKEYSVEEKQRMRETSLSYFATPEGKLTREQMSESHKGKVFSEEHCKNISKAKMGVNHPLFGKHLSTEYCDKISEGLYEYYNSPEGKLTREKLSIANSGENNSFYGKHHTKKSKNTISKKKKDYYASPEGVLTRKKISEVQSLSVEVIEQRREDIKNEPKTWGWKTRLGVKWGLHMGGVCYFINEYASDLDIDLKKSRNLVIKQRRLDIKNISKVWGYKTELSEKWKIGLTATRKFLNKHASDLI